MRVLPILFNTEMVRAILDGRKSCTRRLVKPQLPQNVNEIHEVDTIGYLMFKTDDRLLDGWRNRKSPYQVGDILYVRETWARLFINRAAGYKSERYVYKASDKYPFGEKYIVKFKWRPSIHMPKKAARIWLKVTDIKVSRLREMNTNDFLNEGICLLPQTFSNAISMVCAHAEKFKSLWNSTVKEDWKKWDANPWVWVIGFKRCEEPEEGGKEV